MLLSRMPLEVNYNKGIINQLKKIDWNKIDILDEEVEGSIAYINFNVPIKGFNNKSISFKLEGTYSEYLLQPHIDLAQSIQRIGLGYKLYTKIVYEFGNLYSRSGSRHNKMIKALYEKVSNDKNIELHTMNNNYLLLLKSNPDYNNIINDFYLINKAA